MGMGEPLDNPVAVRRSLELLTHPHAFAMARSKVAVSTVGASPAAILRMRDMPCRLAWSVHAATDTVRRLLVPTTSHTMAELRYTSKPSEEYVQIGYASSFANQIDRFFITFYLIRCSQRCLRRGPEIKEKRAPVG